MAVIFGLDTNNLFGSKNREVTGNESSGGLFADKRITRLFVIATIILIFTLSIHFFYFRAAVKDQENKINEIFKWEQQALNCGQQIADLTMENETLSEKEFLTSGKFVTDDEFESFYADLTEASFTHKLIIK